MEIPNKLYHGTCNAFVAYALQNGENLGPDYDAVSFAPNIEHAKTFARSWQTSAGRKRLEEFFGKNLKEEHFEPIILEIRSSSLGKLQYREDCGEDEFYVERGPVSISSAKGISVTAN